MKKIISGLLVLLLASSIISCGPEEKETQGSIAEVTNLDESVAEEINTEETVEEDSHTEVTDTSSALDTKSALISGMVISTDENGFEINDVTEPVSKGSIVETVELDVNNVSVYCDNALYQIEYYGYDEKGMFYTKIEKASKEDVNTGDNVSLEGSWEKDKFNATKVLILIGL